MVFFLAGVHGVGKTSLCSRLAEELKIASVSAGELIKQQLEKAAWPSDKKTLEIANNQKALMSAVQEFELKNGCFLLDGHFALLSHEGHIVDIELDVIASLNLSAVIFIEDTPRAISMRLERRDHVRWDIELIADLQQAEKKGALNFCGKYNTPLLVGAPSNFTGIRDFIIANMKKDIR